MTDSAILDTSINAPVIQSPNGGVSFTTGNSYATIVGTTDIDTNTMTINGLSMAYTKGAGSFSVRVALAQGANTFVLQATDNAGNISPTTSMTITYDPTLSTANQGADSTLNLENVEAQTINLQRASTNPNNPSEVFSQENSSLNNSMLPRLTNNQ